MTDFNKLTTKELRAYAKKHDINLEGRDKKADIIYTIEGAQRPPLPTKNKPEGQLHIEAAELDRKACEKASA